MPILRLSTISSLRSQLSVEERELIKPRIDALIGTSSINSTTKITHDWGDVADPPEYDLHLDAKRDRTSNEMESWVEKWFQDSISFLQNVDFYLATLV